MMFGRDDFQGGDLMVFEEIFTQQLAKAAAGDTVTLELLSRAAIIYLRSPTHGGVMNERIARIMEVLLQRARENNTVNTGPYR